MSDLEITTETADRTETLPVAQAIENFAREIDRMFGLAFHGAMGDISGIAVVMTHTMNDKETIAVHYMVEEGGEARLVVAVRAQAGAIENGEDLGETE